MGKKKFNERRKREEKFIVSKTPESNDNAVIVWSFEKVDRNGEFAFDLNREDFELEDFFKKLLDFSTMKWCELFPPDESKSRHHPLSESSLSKQALSRIKALQLEEDTDNLYSLALGGKVRLIGIRRGTIFQVIWYDANHEFAPSEKKHT